MAWVKNRVGAYEWKPRKGGGLKLQKNPRSGWYKHPKNGRTVWYDSKTNTFHDKIGGPAKKALSIGWDLTGGGIIENATNLAKDALKVGKVAYQADKAQRKAKADLMDKTLSDTGRLLDTLLVTKTDPGFVNVTDKSGTPPKQKTVKQKLNEAKDWATKNSTEGYETKTDAQKANSTNKVKVNQIIKETKPGSDENIEAQNLSKVIEADQNKINQGVPAIDNVVETVPTEKTVPKGRSKLVGKNTTWVDRSGNVIAPKVDSELDFKRRRNMFQLTKEERKKIIMTSLEQEMYW